MHLDNIVKSISGQARLAWRMRAPLPILRGIVEMLHAFWTGGLEITVVPTVPPDSDDNPQLVLRTVIQSDGDAMFIFNPGLLATEANQAGLSANQIIERHIAEVKIALAPMQDIQSLSALFWSLAAGATTVAEATLLPWSDLFTIDWLAMHWTLLAADLVAAAAPVGIRMLGAPLVRRILAAWFAQLNRKTVERSIHDLKRSS